MTMRTGIATVFHPHCGGYVETPLEIDALMRRTDPTRLGLVLDTGHIVYGGGDPLSVFNEHRDRVWHVHFKDCQPSLTAKTLAATPVMLAGNEEQKKKYLGMLTSEPVYAAYAITEPAAGSDAAGIQCTARQVGDDWVLNGQKCYITNASMASWYVIFATIDASQRHKTIMAFVVDRDTPGLSIGRKEDKLGQRASDTATVILEDVKVHKRQVLAEPGKGFKVAMETFDRTRPDIGAGACGLMRRAMDEAARFALERKTFGTPIPNPQAAQFSNPRHAVHAGHVDRVDHHVVHAVARELQRLEAVAGLRHLVARALQHGGDHRTHRTRVVHDQD